jgi:hypothetical protein
VGVAVKELVLVCVALRVAVLVLVDVTVEVDDAVEVAVNEIDIVDDAVWDEVDEEVLVIEDDQDGDAEGALPNPARRVQVPLDVPSTPT